MTGSYVSLRRAGSGKSPAQAHASIEAGALIVLLAARPAHANAPTQTIFPLIGRSVVGFSDFFSLIIEVVCPVASQVLTQCSQVLRS